MIYETKEISSELLSGLKPNNYTRRIKSHFAAYGLVSYQYSTPL